MKGNTLSHTVFALSAFYVTYLVKQQAKELNWYFQKEGNKAKKAQWQEGGRGGDKEERKIRDILGLSRII